jgi:membrane fusion protein (multidrug efflux system)
MWLIADGLKDGERIVVDGGLKLAPGVPVKALSPEEAAAAEATAATAGQKPATSD